MTIPRRLALLAALLATVALMPSGAMAQSPDDPPPTRPVEPIDGDRLGNEVVHSWAIAPAGTEEDGGTGNRADLSYVADPGSVIRDAVTLYNLSNVPLTFDIYATDAFNDTDGQFALLGADDTPTGVGTWIELGGAQVSVPARTQVTIPFTLTIPDGARPGDHAGAVLAANAAVSTGPEGQQLTLDRRTSTGLFVRVNGPLVPELVIADVQTDYHPSLDPLSGSATVTYRIENRGNVRMGGSATASVSGPFGLGRVTSLPAVLANLLPGQSVTIEETFDSLPALGVVRAEIRLEPTSEGAAALDVSTRRSTSFAPPITVLLVLLAALFGVLAWRAIRRHQDRAALADPSPPSIGDVIDVDAREPEHSAR